MEEVIQLRGTIPIYYASMTGCSKSISIKFQQQLQKQNFIAPLINVGDWQEQQFLEQQNNHTAVFFLSTFGSGGPTQDAQEFFNWINFIQKQKQLLKNMNFMIFALGNSTFQHFCGHGKKIRQCFINHGAKQIYQISLADASSTDQQYQQKYEKWFPKAIQILKSTHQLKEYPKSKVLKSYDIQFINPNNKNNNKPLESQNWQEKAFNFCLGIQCSAFLKAFKAQVIHIKQLRKLTNKDRSTLWIRIKKPKELQLTPGCNVNVYPQNVLTQQDLKKQQVINHYFMKIKVAQNAKIKKLPFPEMPYEQFLKIINSSQIAPSSLIKTGLMVSDASQEIKQKYQSLLKQHKPIKVTSRQVIKQLNLSPYYETLLGVNHARPYTLCSWSQQHIDLMMSVVPNGLTSNFFKSLPKFIRLKQTQSSFVVPTESPLIMIGNGTGMAPFRSILQYVSSLPVQKRIKLTLFYGCQRQDDDFYFNQQWKQAQKNQLIKIHLAQSRKDPQHKQYVQDLIGKSLQLFKKHIFDQNGKIFICGGDQMSKAVKSKIFEVCKMKQKIPFKAYKLHNQLIQQKVIVQQVFH